MTPLATLRSIAPLALVALTATVPAHAQTCPPGTALHTVTTSGATPMTTPPWFNQSLLIPQFNVVPGTVLVQADVLVECTMSGSFQAENLSTLGPCVVAWSIAAATQVTMPAGPPVLLNPEFNGTAPLSTFDGSINFGGTSGVTQGVPTTTSQATVSFTNPAVLASAFTGIGTVQFLHSAVDDSVHQGCGGLVVQSSETLSIRITVTYTWCTGTPITSLCAGDGSLATPCPCNNFGIAGRGCENSAATGGAQLTATGSTASDTVVLTSSGELATSLSIVLQGNVLSPNGVPFGDGLRCAGGTLKRLYTKTATGGTISAPGPGDPSIKSVSASLGDPLFPGATRIYQVYYRDPVAGFCAAPVGDGFNVGNALSVVW